MVEKIIAVMLMMVLLAVPAHAEGLAQDVLAEILPGGVAIDLPGENSAAFEAVVPDTGERVQVICDASGNAVRVETIEPAQADGAAAPVERSIAEAVVSAVYPDCRIFFAEDTGAGKRLGIAHDAFCGSITVEGERIVSRSLETGEIYRGGMLTPDGARRILALHRPGISVLEIEFDADDGIQIYEGEAMLSDTEYEFEMDARSGKLLEWERD